MNLVMIFGVAALAQTATVPVQEPPIAETPAAPTHNFVRLPALTPLRLRVIGEVSSKTNVKGDKVVIAKFANCD